MGGRVGEKRNMAATLEYLQKTKTNKMMTTHTNLSLLHKGQKSLNLSTHTSVFDHTTLCTIKEF